MNLIQEEITIGEPKSNLESFNDMNCLKTHVPPYKIKKITVQSNNEHIWGLKIFYLTGDGKEVKG